MVAQNCFLPYTLSNNVSILANILQKYSCSVKTIQMHNHLNSFYGSKNINTKSGGRGEGTSCPACMTTEAKLKIFCLEAKQFGIL